MIQRKWMMIAFAVAYTLVGMAAPAQAQDVELAWKFKKGDTFYQEMNAKTTQTMTILNQKVQQEQDQTLLFKWSVQDADDKQTVIEQKIEAVKMSIKIGGQDIKYDSTAKDAADNPLASFFKPLVGGTFKLTLGPDLKVTKIEGRDEFVKKMSDANPMMATLLKTILSDDQLKQMTEPAFTVVKGKGQKVKPNDTWSNASNLNIGPIGSYAAKYNYKYTGTEKVGDAPQPLHKIEMTTEMTYKAPDAKDAGGLQFKIEKADLKTTEAKGTVYFDADKGRVVSTTMTVAIKGTLEISVGDQKSTVELDQKQTTTTKTLDKNPYEAAKASS